MAVAHRFDGVDAADNRGWGGPVVPSIAPGENAGIERAADHDRCAGFNTFGQQILERLLFEQRVTAGEQKCIPVAPFESFQQHLTLVDSDADRVHHAATSQFLECAIAALAQNAHQSSMALVAMLHRADVVNIENVDASQPEPLKTVLERTHDSIIGIVVDRLERQRVPLGVVDGLARAEQTSDFG